MSSPDKRNYSEIPAFTNRFHVHELYADEFAAFLQKEFRHVDFYYQGRFCNSYIFDPGKSVSGIHHEICLRKPDPTEAEYIVAVCSDREIRENPESIVCDADNTYYKMNREQMISLDNARREAEHAQKKAEQAQQRYAVTGLSSSRKRIISGNCKRRRKVMTGV